MSTTSHDVLSQLHGDARLGRAAREYVRACLAIRTADYPSEAFTAAVTRATSAYHAMMQIEAETKQ